MRLSRQDFVVYAVALLAALGLKQHYSTASAEGLRWILAPTATLVSWASGSPFAFERGTGYLSRDLHYVIAGTCAGVNFMIVAFCTAVLAYARYARTARQRAFLLAASAAGAYVAAVAANAIRILIALPLHLNAVSWGWMTAERIHRIEGMVVYLAVLCGLFAVSRSVVATRSRST